MTERIVVVGGGHAAGQLLDGLRKNGYSGEIVLLSDEPSLPYQRPPLSKKYLAGELAPERFLVRPAAYFEKLEIDTRLNRRVIRIEREGQAVHLADGEKLHYDQLALTTGARVRRLPIPPEPLAGVHYLRTLADADAIRAALPEVERVVIIGGGFIGLEAAATLTTLGKQVTVLEMQSRLMARALAPTVGQFVTDRHRDAGVVIALNTQVSAIDGSGRVEQVVCADGSAYPADLVIIGVGVIPNVELAEAAGLACDNGIVVDDRARTADPAIVAAGDCTRHPNAILGQNLRLESVHNAIEQSRTAAATLCGQSRPYCQMPWFWSDQYDFKLQMVGISQGHDRHQVLGDPSARRFSVLYFQQDKLLAVDSVNHSAEHMAARRILNERIEVSPKQASNANFRLVDVLS